MEYTVIIVGLIRILHYGLFFWKVKNQRLRNLWYCLFNFLQINNCRRDKDVCYAWNYSSGNRKKWVTHPRSSFWGCKKAFIISVFPGTHPFRLYINRRSRCCRSRIWISKALMNKPSPSNHSPLSLSFTYTHTSYCLIRWNISHTRQIKDKRMQKRHNIIQ